jgi:hypothetical protein
MTLSQLLQSWLLRSLALLSLACSPLFVRYSLSATMYPHFFAFLQLTIFGLASRRPAIEKAGFLALAYTHYVGQVLFFIYVGVRFLQGEGIRSTLRKYKVVLIGCAPILLLSAVGFVYHVIRSRIGNAPQNYLALLFFVPSALWCGVAYSVYRTLRFERIRSMQPAKLFLLFTTLFFLFVSTVMPPFDRYVYMFLPAVLLLGLMGVASLLRHLTGRTLQFAVGLLFAALLLFPPHAMRNMEPELFRDYVKDNNRYQNWAEVVDLTVGRRLMTNNARSYLYYLSKRDHIRYRLRDLEAAGEIVQFENREHFAEQYEKVRPEQIVTNTYWCLGDTISFIENSLPECKRSYERNHTRIYTCLNAPSSRP